MNDTLKAILKMDRLAQAQVAKAESYREAQIASLAERKEEIRNKAVEKARETAVRESEHTKSEGEVTLSEHAKENAQIIKKMNELYSENGDRWVDDVVASVTQI